MAPQPPAEIARVKELIVRCLNLTDVDPQQIEDEAPLFVEGLGLDSVDALELVVGIEQEFGLQIEDEAIGKEAFASAAALTSFINGRLGPEQQSGQQQTGTDG